MSEVQNPTLGEAASRFLASLPQHERAASQQEVYLFVRWNGSERKLSELTAPAVGNYAEKLSLTDTDHARKLDLVRDFLAYANEQGWTTKNMGVHLKARKGKSKPPIYSRQNSIGPQTLTREGVTKLEKELAELKIKRTEVTKEMQRAAADKDFRENAPLQAAREQKGYLEGQIKELEEFLKSVQVVDENQKMPALKVKVGDSVIVQDATSGEEFRYTLVGPKETDPIRGKISSSSPLGKAIIGKIPDEFIEVVAPAGKLRYQIKKIERTT